MFVCVFLCVRVRTFSFSSVHTAVDEKSLKGVKSCTVFDSSCLTVSGTFIPDKQGCVFQNESGQSSRTCFILLLHSLEFEHFNL